jgi:hypothetical protein
MISATGIITSPTIIHRSPGRVLCPPDLSEKNAHEKAEARSPRFGSEDLAISIAQ